MSLEPKMFISPSYEFYNQCHGEKGRFCEGEDGPGRVRDNPAKGKATVEDYSGVAYRDGITDLNTVYHVTSPEAADAIRQNGFRSGGGNWGNGAYFSPDKKDSTGTYGATAHQQGKEIAILTVRTNVQNPLILETDRTGNFWGQLKTVLNSDVVAWHTQDAKNQTDPDEWLDYDRYAKSNLRYILDNNGNDALLVRNSGGGGQGIGGETLVVPDSSKVWLAN